MTQAQTRRVIEALAETNRLLEAEMRYSADLRNQERVAFYEGHIAKLNGMLAAQAA